ncbi:MAG TPA: CBS domain-containing protein [Bryobacteraceae bacterium]|nr:CBS domain-containing protein [Bryobacteraceae bacterium]HPT29250.1 CBS domain-containing protein [Bryobacteraceae bacterium]
MSQITLAALLETKGYDVYSIAPSASVFEAIKIMSERGVGALIVMEGDELAGILSERDYTRKVVLQGRASRETKVAEIMTPDVITASLDLTLEQAMRLVSERRIRHLPVTKDGRVVGVISSGDMIKTLISLQRETIEQLQHYIGGGYMA